MNIELAYQTQDNGLAIASYNGEAWSSEKVQSKILSGTPAVFIRGDERYYYFTSLSGTLNYIHKNALGEWQVPLPVPRNDVYPPTTFDVSGSPTVGLFQFRETGFRNVLARMTSGQLAEVLGGVTEDPAADTGVDAQIRVGSNVAFLPYWQSQLCLFEGPSQDGSLYCFAISDVSAAGESPPRMLLPSGSITGVPSCVVTFDSAGQPQEVYLFYQGAGTLQGQLLYRTRQFDADRLADYSQGWSDPFFVAGVSMNGSPAAVCSGTTIWIFYLDNNNILNHVTPQNGSPCTPNLLVTPVDMPCVSAL